MTRLVALCMLVPRSLRSAFCSSSCGRKTTAHKTPMPQNRSGHHPSLPWTLTRIAFLHRVFDLLMCDCATEITPSAMLASPDNRKPHGVINVLTRGVLAKSAWCRRISRLAGTKGRGGLGNDGCGSVWLRAVRFRASLAQGRSAQGRLAQGRP